MQRNLNLKNRMREIRSSGTVGVRGGNEPLYPEKEKGFSPRITLAELSPGSNPGNNKRMINFKRKEST